MQHILSADQFDTDQLSAIFSQADFFREQDQNIASRREIMQTHFGRIMLSTFYEPSTRTRFSFEIAAAKLGMAVIGTENAAEFSSAAKGETIEDTTKVLNEYGVDAISMRTTEEGHAQRAAAVSEVPIINGGDGKGEHPTQAVLDAYTIQEQFGSIDNKRVAMVGDLKHGRTVRSLSKLLSMYNGVELKFVSTPELQIGEDIKQQLTEKDVSFSETSDLHDAIREVDVVYMTRLQLERHGSDKRLIVGKNQFVFDAAAQEILPFESIIMHPLPRPLNREIPVYIDDDSRAKYFRQAGNGLYVRMALLDMLMQGRP